MQVSWFRGLVLLVVQIKISDFRQSVFVDQIHWHRMGSTLTLDIVLCTRVFRNTLRYCTTLSNSKTNALTDVNLVVAD